jgi:hypothetical protein
VYCPKASLPPPAFCPATWEKDINHGIRDSTIQPQHIFDGWDESRIEQNAIFIIRNIGRLVARCGLLHSKEIVSATVQGDILWPCSAGLSISMSTGSTAERFECHFILSLEIRPDVRSGINLLESGVHDGKQVQPGELAR